MLLLICLYRYCLITFYRLEVLNISRPFRQQIAEEQLQSALNL